MNLTLMIFTFLSLTFNFSYKAHSLDLKYQKISSDTEFKDSTVNAASFYKKNINNFKIINTSIIGLSANSIKFTNFIISDSKIGFSNLIGLKFKNCTIKNTVFYKSDLSFSDFQNCDLQNVVFTDNRTVLTKGLNEIY